MSCTWARPRMQWTLNNMGYNNGYSWPSEGPLSRTKKISIITYNYLISCSQNICLSVYVVLLSFGGRIGFPFIYPFYSPLTMSPPPGRVPTLVDQGRGGGRAITGGNCHTANRNLAQGAYFHYTLKAK